MPTPAQLARLDDVVEPALARMPPHVAALVRGRLEGEPEVDWRLRTRVDLDAEGYLDAESLRWHVQITGQAGEWLTIAVATPAALGLSDAEVSAELIEAARVQSVRAGSV